MTFSLTSGGLPFGLSRGSNAVPLQAAVVATVFAPRVFSQYNVGNGAISRILAFALVGTSATVATLYSADFFNPAVSFIVTRNGKKASRHRSGSKKYSAVFVKPQRANWIVPPSGYIPPKRDSLLELNGRLHLIPSSFCHKNSEASEKAQTLFKGYQTALRRYSLFSDGLGDSLWTALDWNYIIVASTVIAILAQVCSRGRKHEKLALGDSADSTKYTPQLSIPVVDMLPIFSLNIPLDHGPLANIILEDQATTNSFISFDIGSEVPSPDINTDDQWFFRTTAAEEQSVGIPVVDAPSDEPSVLFEPEPFSEAAAGADEVFFVPIDTPVSVVDASVVADFEATFADDAADSPTEVTVQETVAAQDVVFDNLDEGVNLVEKAVTSEDSVGDVAFDAQPMEPELDAPAWNAKDVGDGNLSIVNSSSTGSISSLNPTAVAFVPIKPGSLPSGPSFFQPPTPTVSIVITKPPRRRRRHNKRTDRYGGSNANTNENAAGGSASRAADWVPDWANA